MVSIVDQMVDQTATYLTGRQDTQTSGWFAQIKGKQCIAESSSSSVAVLVVWLSFNCLL